ncbi:uncharacterized protein LOC143879719 [Tasmannia lanceolata]|uniref:uncharacterized protein LOC143879719 n=1 Tax=Tasmannia lanceolata TaxID=3420 RepID=UPI00406394E1
MKSLTDAESSVRGNWNSSPSMMSFVGLGLESNPQKQFWDLETTTNFQNNTSHNNNNNNNNNNSSTFINPTTSFLDYSSSLPNHLPPSNYSPIPEFYTSYMKREEGCFGNYSTGRIGLNLGHRTYFSSRESALIDRLFKRSRGLYQGNQIPRCQAEGCKVDLTNAKHYHRRHKVCEFHSKATKVVAGGIEQRFCQQCSRFHVLAEFDEVKRSCRKRLADHNRRRRKPQPGTEDQVATTTKTVEKCTDKRGQIEKNTSVTPKEKSLSSTLPLLIAKGDENLQKPHYSHNKILNTQMQINGPDLSLGGIESHITYTSEQPFSSSNFMLNCHQNFFYSSSNEASASQSSDQSHQQQPEDLQNLLHLGHAMFQVDLL